MAQWIRLRTVNREVPSSILLAAAVVSLGKALYPHCLVPRKGLKVQIQCFNIFYHRQSVEDHSSVGPQTLAQNMNVQQSLPSYNFKK